MIITAALWVIAIYDISVSVENLAHAATDCGFYGLIQSTIVRQHLIDNKTTLK